MRTYFLVIFLTIVFISPLWASTVSIPPVRSFPTLPQQIIANQTQNIQQEFEQRATFFLKGRHPKPWQANRPQEEILKEFQELNDWRFHSWYVDPHAKTLISRADFMVAQDLLEKGLYRKPSIIAFQYNRTDPSYNSSTIVINGFKFLALDAPTSLTLKNFFVLLKNYRVTQLVRLTAATENTVEKSFPYWDNKIKQNPQAQETYLNIPEQDNAIPYRMLYYSIDNWKDDQGIKPQELLTLIQEVRKKFDPNGGLLACHSTTGAGRTGTFLAGFLLLADIDKQLASGTPKNELDISIEKIVMQISLKRPYMVTTAEQYITLYRLIDLYVQGLK